MTNEQLTALRKAAERVKGWGNCNQAWLDTSEDEPTAVVGNISEDGEACPVAVIDCDQYYVGQDSLPLAKFYALANPATILSMLDHVERLEKERDDLLIAVADHVTVRGFYMQQRDVMLALLEEAKNFTNCQAWSPSLTDEIKTVLASAKESK